MKLPIELIDKIAFFTNDIETHTSLRKAICIINPRLFKSRIKEFVKDYLPDLVDMVGGIDKLAESEYFPDIDHYKINFSRYFSPVYEIKPRYLSHNIMVGINSNGFKFLCIKFYEEKSESVLLDDKIPYTLIFYQTHSIESKMWKTTISKNKYTTPECSIKLNSNLFLQNDYIYDSNTIQICKKIINNDFILDDKLKETFGL